LSDFLFDPQEDVDEDEQLAALKADMGFNPIDG
jgi:hypothetical protein